MVKIKNTSVPHRIETQISRITNPIKRLGEIKCGRWVDPTAMWALVMLLRILFDRSVPMFYIIEV